MKASPQLTLPAAVTAAVLALTTFIPATALDAGQEPGTEAPAARTLSADTHGDVTSKVVESAGDIVSTTVDAATGEPVLRDPALAGTRPAEGAPNGGAVMGQWAKSAEHFQGLVEDSARTAAELAGEPVAAAASTPPASAAAVPGGIKGTDVSGWQTSLNWSSLWNQGSRFAYVKASEGDTIDNDLFGQQYAGAGTVGMYRGAYHFAIPTRDSSGAKQADYFLSKGGGWSPDGKTLPGLLDVENNPYPSLYGDACYGFSDAEMVNWIRDFSNRYKARTGRLPAIYTNYYWWVDCTGNSSAFNDHPMHIAAYGTSAPRVPSGWSTYDFWQYTDSGFQERIDANVFRGTASQLGDLVRNAYYKPLGGTVPDGGNTLLPHSPYSVKGAIGAKWARLGGAAGLGTPIMNEKGGLAEGGVYQEFKRADGRKSTIYWSPTHGAHVMHNTASIGKKWISEGREHHYGLPSTDERSIAGGAYQVFRRDGRSTKVLWSPATGSRAIKEYGAIGREWKAAGYERGYGFPVTDEYVHGSEIRQRFSKNFTIHYDDGRTWVTR